MADVQNVDPVMQKPWQRARMNQKYEYFKKSALPPMQIEPLPLERSRLSGDGMTVPERALRKQWVKDQVLHHEPRVVPQLKPLNIFRRIYRFPADLLILKPATAMFSKETASVMRYTIPKILMGLGASYLIWYSLKYNQNDWTRNGGVVMYQGRQPILYDGGIFPEKDKTDYYDRGFSTRKALLYKPSEPSA